MILAITGGTGFVGSHLIDLATAAGHQVRALARQPQAARESVAWIAGTLHDPASLATLVEGADAVIHVAGVVTAPDRAGFAAGNVAGTRAILDAALAAGVERFVHVSSLSAREPQLSNYGWSKAQAETLVEASGLDWTIVRPTGVYGPGDTELRDLFRSARLGIALMPPPGRVSLVHVGDLARLLLTLAERPGERVMYEVDDGTSLTHGELARAVGAAVGRKVVVLHLPPVLLRVGAWLDHSLRGAAAKLTADRVGYLVHDDWTADPARRPPAALWKARIDQRVGLADTAAWYRAGGLL